MHRLVHSIFLCIYLLVLVGVVVCDDYYPITWAQVATTETKIKAKDLVQCLCDLTYYQCDPNCCCDSDCSITEKALFSGCTSEGLPPDDTICIDASDVFVVNRVTASEKGGQLCIVRNNNPSLGLYFADPKTVTSTNFDEFLATDLYTFPDVALSDSTYTTYPSTYTVGDLILQVGTPKISLVLPAANIFGRCSASNPAAFLFENQSYTCNVYSSDLATDCGTSFDASKYVQGIFVAKTPADTEGTEIKVTSVNGVNGATLPSSAYSGSTCTNALLKISFLVVHDGKGAIVNVSVEVWTTSVSEWGAGLGTSVTQSFSIGFLNGTSSASIVRAKSGNPGYLIGKPVLLGNSTSNDGITQAILQPTTALTLFGTTASGDCGVGLGPEITFGDEVLVGCKVSVPSTLTDSTTTCQSFASTIMLIMRENIPTYVGMFGNADYMDIYEWASVYEALPDSSTLNSAGAYCTNIPNQIQFQFITTYAGPLKAPQAKILSGRIDYTTVTVSASKTSLELYASVTFANIAAIDVLQENLPSPPLMKPLPDDILYPFKLSEAPQFCPFVGIPFMISTILFFVI